MAQERRASAGQLQRWIQRPLLETKLDPPIAARRAPILRQTLVERILGSTAPVVVLSAPAGYGKTTLLAQCSVAARRPVAWVSLEDADNDPALLLMEISTALARVIAFDPLVLGGLVTAEPALYGDVLPRMLNSLTQAPECILVIDDAHHLTALESLNALTFLCEHLPPGVRLLVGARAVPGLPLGRLRVRGSLLELGPDDLAFSREEAACVVTAHDVVVDRETLDVLYTTTEGWPVGIYLAALAARQSDDPKRTVLEFDGTDRDVVDYLATELLSEQDDDRLDFLFCTSVLDRFCAPLCDAVLQRTDSASVLAALEHSNRFLVPLDRKGVWYRYHHIFGQALQLLALRRGPRRAASVHERAARWHATNGHTIDAIEHALAGRDRTFAADLVARRMQVLFNGGHQTRVYEWLETFSDADMVRSPALALAAAWVRLQHGDIGHTLRCVRIVERTSVDGPLPFGESAFTAALALLRATLGWDGLGEMERDARMVVERTQDPARCAAALCVGASLYLRGQLAAASDRLVEAAVAGDEDACTAVLANALLALVALDEHRVGEAEARVRAGCAVLRGRGLTETAAGAALQTAAARLAVELGDHAAARTNLERAVCLLRRATALPWLAIQLGIALAEVAIALDELMRAEALLGQARRALLRYPDSGRLPHLLADQEHALEVARGGASVLDEPLTQAELRVLALAPTHLTLEEIGNSLHISRNTVKTHLKAIYGKLEVATRGDAVERARALRLLHST